MANYGNINTANQYAGMMPYQQMAMPSTQIPLEQPNNNSVSSKWYGTPSRSQQVYNYTPYQMSAMNQALSRGLGGLDQFDFAPIEQKARSQFQQQTLPSIAERFTSMGAQNSSAFNSAMGQAGAGLEENLASMKQNYNLQRQPLFQQLMSMGLQPQFDRYRDPAVEGMNHSFANIGMQELFSALSGLTKSFGNSGDNFDPDQGPRFFGDIQPGDQGESGGGIPWGTIAQIGIPAIKLLLSMI